MSKKLVAYFSCSGVSRHNAQLFSQVLGADIYEIKPKIPYSEDDLDWTNEKSRSSIEMKNKKIRPEVADNNAKADKYDEIILVFPIWWYVAPTIVNTFLESYKLEGKRIVLFPTSGSSNFGNTAKELKPSVDPSTVIEEVMDFIKSFVRVSIFDIISSFIVPSVIM